MNISLSIIDSSRTLVVVDDTFFQMRPAVIERKRDRKAKNKQGNETPLQGVTLKRSTVSAYRNLLNQLFKKRRVKVVSKSGFEKIINEYLYYCTFKYHSDRGAKISKKDVPYTFSVASK